MTDLERAIINLRRQNLSKPAIALLLGVGVSTVCRVIAAANDDPLPQAA